MPAIDGVLTVTVTGVAYVLTPHVLGLVILFALLLLGRTDFSAWHNAPWPPAAVWMSGLLMSTIPYAVGGLFVGWVSRRRHTAYPWSQVAALGVVAAAMERVVILGGAYLTYLAHLDVFKGQEWLGVLQAEALPYYTPAYIGAGLVVSPLVLLAAARAATRRPQAPLPRIQRPPAATRGVEG